MANDRRGSHCAFRCQMVVARFRRSQCGERRVAGAAHPLSTEMPLTYGSCPTRERYGLREGIRHFLVVHRTGSTEWSKRYSVYNVSARTCTHSIHGNKESPSRIAEAIEVSCNDCKRESIISDSAHKRSSGRRTQWRPTTASTGTPAAGQAAAAMLSSPKTDRRASKGSDTPGSYLRRGAPVPS